MFHVCLDCTAESLLGAFHEVAAATAMDVDLNTTGNNVHALCVDYFCANYSKVAICNFKNLVITDDNRTILQPTLWSQDFTIDNLLKHNICS